MTVRRFFTARNAGRLAAAALLASVLLNGCASEGETRISAPESIDAGIEEHRKGDMVLTLVDASGQPLPEGTEVRIEMTGHEFLFGSNFFQWGALDDRPVLRELYRERFAGMMNFATLPFYWCWYEGEEGRPDLWTRSGETALWCRDRGIRTKGHPLVWHECYPQWAEDFTREEMVSALRKRVEGIVAEYGGLIDTWDVINESQASPQWDNPLGTWVKDIGPDEAVREAFAWARGSSPDGYYLINDYDVLDESYAQQIRELIESGTVPDAVGVQSHMHHGVWSDERILDVYERLEPLGLPIHFTELTVLSGRAMKGSDFSYDRDDWISTPEGEARQAEELVRIYRLLFSLPAVEAVTYWDFSDYGAWMGAPAGLLRKDMTPKPAYEELMHLIRDEWTTEIPAVVDAAGRVAFRGFYGTYRVVSGEAEAEFTLASDGPDNLRLSF